MRLAIVHFTGPPEIGGVEALIASQVAVLASMGVEVDVVVGRGGTIAGATVHVLPALDPASHAPRGCEDISTALWSIVSRSHACWVHNLLTVEIDPAITRAIWGLIAAHPEMDWVGWCEDLTASSRFREWSGAHGAELPVSACRYVTISRARAGQLARFLGVGEDSITVIEPPVNVVAWLDLGPETRALRYQLGLEARDPFVLVPSKLLEHKNLQLAVAVAAELGSFCPSALVLVTGAASPHEPAASRGVAARLRAVSTELGAGTNFALVSDLLGRDPSWRTVRELMMLCDLVMVPSEEEGFGMPIREAQLLRVPVVCSDVPAFREAAGEAATFFSLSDQPASIAETVAALASTQDARRRQLVHRSYSGFCESLKLLLPHS